MRKFSYTINDNNGIHARPAGLIVKLASTFDADIKAELNGKSADMKKIFSVMSLGAKCGDTLNVYADGPDENEAIDALEIFLKENL